MRVWQKDKNRFTGETWFTYGDFRVVPRTVQMPRVGGQRRRKPHQRWFVYDGKSPRPVGAQNGYDRLKDAKAQANETLDERNRQFHAARAAV